MLQKGTGMTNDQDRNSTDEIDAMGVEAQEPSGEGQEERPAYSQESFERDSEGRPAYVRQPKPHRRQPPVNDLQADEDLVVETGDGVAHIASDEVVILAQVHLRLAEIGEELVVLTLPHDVDS